MITYHQADDEINATFLTAWNAESGAIVGYVPEIRWQNVQRREIPDGSKFWVRISKDTVYERQATLSTCEGIPGQRKYTANGLVFVQLFCPKSNAQAFELGQQLAIIARNSFRGKTTPGNIWFRNVRINELQPDELFYRLNIIAEFEYDELG
jgi:hypothetical protein